jgi:hypothetical protein
MAGQTFLESLFLQGVLPYTWPVDFDFPSDFLNLQKD